MRPARPGVRHAVTAAATTLLLAAAVTGCGPDATSGTPTSAPARPGTVDDSSTDGVVVAPFATEVDGELRLTIADDERLVATFDDRHPDATTVHLPAGSFTLYGHCSGPTPIELTFVDGSSPLWVVPCDGAPSRLRGQLAAERTAELTGQLGATWEILLAEPSAAPTG